MAAYAADSYYSDRVSFEICGPAIASRLMHRLARSWSVNIVCDGEIGLVVVQLPPRPTDVAALLREVERFIAEESLCAVRFDLDGRSYVLEAGEADWAKVPVGKCS